MNARRGRAQSHSFFAPLARDHPLRFFSDMRAETAGIGPAFHGMVEQLVASRGRTFSGTFMRRARADPLALPAPRARLTRFARPLFLRRSPSTFSGFITRLRGYLGHSDNSTFYFAPTEKYDALHHRTWPTSPYYTREWPIAWEDIDLPDGSPPWDAARERESTQRANRQRKRAEDCAQKERLGFSVITGKCSETERYFGVEPAAG